MKTEMKDIIKVTSLLSGAIVLPYETDEREAIEKAARALYRACPGATSAGVEFSVYRRSTDARRRDKIRFTYSILMTFPEPFECDAEALRKEGLRVRPDDSLVIEHGDKIMSSRPIIVGTGPAGMFCALLLAENGYKPIVLERGSDLSRRISSVGAFLSGGELDTETNVMFGAGGAGTFSDGKLVTRINDPLTSYVLSRMNTFGAPREILSRAKPHVGTDLLRGVVDGILKRIEECGGEIRYNCRMDRIKESDNGSELTVETTDGDITGGVAVVAIGHSARDTYQSLMKDGFAVEAKPFSVGVRIEHLTEDIDRAMFGRFAGDPRLGHAEYTLSDTASGRGVYTFCMCPGGEVIAAASENGGVVVNGMSYHARDGKNSNCALAVSIMPTDYDGSPAGAIEFQRNIERAAFASGGGDFAAPVETVGDFLSRKRRNFTELTKVMPTYDRGKTRLCDLTGLFPEYVTEELERGIRTFGRRIAGFDAPEAIMTGVETRTSAPVRILRNDEGAAVGHPLVYPCGEGAGYAGGITSAAVDGLRTALAIIGKYRPFQ